MFERFRRRLSRWISPKRRRQPPVAWPKKPSSRSLWSGEGSQTEQQILALFTDDSVRLTRKQIDHLIDVKTASQILPSMVRGGLLLREPNSWPYIYRRVTEAQSREFVNSALAGTEWDKRPKSPTLDAVDPVKDTEG